MLLAQFLENKLKNSQIKDLIEVGKKLTVEEMTKIPSFDQKLAVIKEWFADRTNQRFENCSKNIKSRHF